MTHSCACNVTLELVFSYCKSRKIYYNSIKNAESNINNEGYSSVNKGDEPQNSWMEWVSKVPKRCMGPMGYCKSQDVVWGHIYRGPKKNSPPLVLME